MKAINFLSLPVLLLSAVSLFADDAKKLSKADLISSLTHRVTPDYPAAARQLRMEGSVELKISIDDSGTVGKVDILSGNPVLTKPAAAAVRQWKFNPAKAGNAEGMVTVTFKL